MPTAENAFVLATPLEELAATDSGRDVRLASCHELDRIVVRTRNTTYEMIVLVGDTGEVLMRGGEFFNQFRRAWLVGSILGGSTVKLGTICIGCHLELHVDATPIVTSRIEDVSCFRIPVAEAAA